MVLSLHFHHSLPSLLLISPSPPSLSTSLLPSLVHQFNPSPCFLYHLHSFRSMHCHHSINRLISLYPSSHLPLHLSLPSSLSPSPSSFSFLPFCLHSHCIHQILDSVHHIHQHDIVHRDLKVSMGSALAHCMCHVTLACFEPPMCLS